MKKQATTLSRLFLIGITILSTLTTIFAATDVSVDGLHAGNENIPFDFTDKYYLSNGVHPGFIINRINGADKFSVFSFTQIEKFRNVRAILTLPAYGANGEILYYSPFGDLFREGFIEDKIGKEAMATANRYPLYVFPSSRIKSENRQASLIEHNDGYFEKNPLGVSVVVEVEYTDLIYTKEAQEFLASLAKRNGMSLDGTPIIKTVGEIHEMTRMNLITQKIRGLFDKSQPSYTIANVIENPERGAIMPDAFLEYVRNIDTQKPLPAEAAFVENFECLQIKGAFCSK